MQTINGQVLAGNGQPAPGNIPRGTAAADIR